MVAQVTGCLQSCLSIRYGRVSLGQNWGEVGPHCWHHAGAAGIGIPVGEEWMPAAGEPSAGWPIAPMVVATRVTSPLRSIDSKEGRP